MHPAFYLVPLAAAVAFGAWYIGEPAPAPKDTWTVVRDLPRHYQLRDADIKGPKERWRIAKMPKKTTLVGQHLVADKKAGAPLAEPDVLPNPVLPARGGTLGVLVHPTDKEKAFADSVEIGHWVRLCYTRDIAGAKDTAPKSKCTRRTVAVEAIHRATSDKDTTWVALRVPECMTVEIGEYLARDKRFLLVAAMPPDGAAR